MALTVLFRPEAESDLRSASRWYDEQERDLGRALVEATRATVLGIQKMPRMYAFVFRNLRRAKVKKFPYLIYYRVFSDRIEVMGILHSSRDPKLWQGRVS